MDAGCKLNWVRETLPKLEDTQNCRKDLLETIDKLAEVESLIRKLNDLQEERVEKISLESLLEERDVEISF
jgi:hypothetical protein